MDTPLGQPALIGRTRETAAFAVAAARVQSGSAAVVLVTGEAGSGKTRFMREVVSALGHDGWRTGTGHALPGQGLPPYYVFARVVRQLMRETDSTSAATREALPILAAAGLAIDDVSPGAAAVDSAAGRLRLMEALAQVLEEAAGSVPLVISLDDMQWAGRGDWEAIEHASRSGQRPILFVLGARSPDVWDADSPAAATLRELSRLRLLTQVELAPLNEQATSDLVAGLLGAPPSVALSDAIFARSGGNAFFVEELVAHLASRGRLRTHDGTWDFSPTSTPTEIPPTVGLAIRDRLEAIPPATRSLLEVAAVAGRQVESATIAKAVGQPVLRIVEQFQPAVAAGVVLDIGSGWTFRHDLVREAILQSVHDRAAVHAAIAQALAARGMVSPQDHAALSAIAHHWTQAGRHHEAAEAALAASLRASEAYAPDEAFQLAQTAWEAASELDGGDRYPVESRCLLRLGEAARDCGDFARAHRAFIALQQLAAEHDDHAIEGVGLLRIADLARRREQPEDAARDYRLGIAMLESHDGARQDLAKALIEYTWLCGLTLADYASAETAGNRALVLARDLGDAALAAEVTVALASAETRAHGPRAARKALEAALERAVSAQHLGLAAEVAASLSNNYYWSGELRRARHFGERRLAYAEASHDIFGLRHGHSWLALVACSQGAFDEALTLLATAEPVLARLDSPEPLAFVRIVSGVVRLQLGDVEEAYRLLREGFDSLKPLGDGTLVWYGGLLVYACLAAGRTREAASELEAQEVRVAALPVDALPARSARCALGMVYARLGEIEKGRACEEALAPYAEDFHWWPARRTLAALCELRGDRQGAVEHLEIAIATAREEDQRPDLAAMLVHKGQLLPGDSGDLQAVFDEAIHLAGDLGMVHLRDSALAAKGLLAPAEKPFGLTTREREVLALLSSGKTNREIARSLVISERTVINHLSHIFAKLQVDNRASATALAIRSGLA